MKIVEDNFSTLDKEQVREVTDVITKNIPVDERTHSAPPGAAR